MRGCTSFGFWAATLSSALTRSGSIVAGACAPGACCAGAVCATGAAVRAVPAACWLPRTHPTMMPNRAPAMPKTIASALIIWEFSGYQRAAQPVHQRAPQVGVAIEERGAVRHARDDVLFAGARRLGGDVAQRPQRQRVLV